MSLTPRRVWPLSRLVFLLVLTTAVGAWAYPDIRAFVDPDDFRGFQPGDSLYLMVDTYDKSAQVSLIVHARTARTNWYNTSLVDETYQRFEL